METNAKTIFTPKSIALASAAVTGTLLGLDLTWLGVIAKGFYAAQLGAMQAPEVQWPAALMFYVMYVGFIVGWAVLPAASVKQAGGRGAGLGLLAYGTYELTNWAVLRGWPAALVPVDLLWGIVLTSAAAAVGRWASAPRSGG